MRTQLVAASAVAEVLATWPPIQYRPGPPLLEVAGPQEERLVEMAHAARRPPRPRGEITGVTNRLIPDKLNDDGGPATRLRSFHGRPSSPS